MLTRKLLYAACITIAISGCRVWTGTDESRGGSVASQPTAANSADDWNRGRLPAAVLEGQPKSGGELVAQLGTDPPSLNTLVDSDWGAAHLTEHRIYEALVEVDPYDHPNYRHRPGLAERWEVSDDKRTYTFYLRKNVTWHDGMPFSAKDVIATFTKVQDPTTKAMHVRAYTQDLESFEALDDYTVRFRLKKPYFLVMDGIFADVSIQPAHIISKLSGSEYNDAATNSINRHPIGTGPFRFESWVSNQRITLVRNDQYYRRKPYLQRLVFRIVKEATISLELAERQELDLVTRIRAEQWVKMDRARLYPKYNRMLAYEPNYAWIGYNQNRTIFQDRVVRRALTQLIDRPGIISSLQHGLARPTSCHFFSDSGACDPQLSPIAYDPVHAVESLEKAGFRDTDGDGVRERNGRPFKFSLMIPAGSEDVARMGTLMKESLMRAGIEMQLQRVEWSAFVRRLRDRDFDACTLAWSNSSPRSDPTQVWHSSSIGGGSNYVGFRNALADKLMDAARVEFDDNKRNALYRRFGQILYDEQPYTWLYTRPRLALIHRRVHGVRESLVGFIYEDIWVEGERNAGPSK